MLLTVLNIINYFAGRPMSINVLVTISLLVYYSLIQTYWNEIMNNNLYFWLIIILLIVDISCIIVIYFDFKTDVNIQDANSGLFLNVVTNSENSENNENKLNCKNGVCKLNKSTDKNKNRKKSKKNKNKDKLIVYDDKTMQTLNTYVDDKV